MRLLITSGATREPIDGVRFISNFSTGTTGARLADFFAELGFEVTYLRGEGAAEPASRCEILGFSSFQSLDELLRRELGRAPVKRYFAVIHLAAVSDYSVHEVRAGGRSFLPTEEKKLDSSQEEMSLLLKRNFKIVDRLKSYAGAEHKPLVVAFKLTNGAAREAALEAVRRVASSGEVDAVVHNDLAQITAAGARSAAAHCFELFPVGGSKVSPRVCPKVCNGTAELGTALMQWFGQSVSQDIRETRI